MKRLANSRQPSSTLTTTARPLSSATPSSLATLPSHGPSSPSTWLSTLSCTGTTSRVHAAFASGGRSTSPLAKSPNSSLISVSLFPENSRRPQLMIYRLHLLCILDLLCQHLLATPPLYGQVRRRGICGHCWYL